MPPVGCANPEGHGIYRARMTAPRGQEILPIANQKTTNEVITISNFSQFPGAWPRVESMPRGPRNLLFFPRADRKKELRWGSLEKERGDLVVLISAVIKTRVPLPD